MASTAMATTTVSSFDEDKQRPLLARCRAFMPLIQAPKGLFAWQLGKMEVNEIIAPTARRGNAARAGKRRSLPSPPAKIPPEAGVGVTGIPQADANTPKANAAAQAPPLSGARPRSAPTEDDEPLYLHSTPYTLTMPTFRHGPIKIPKPDSRGNLVPDGIRESTCFQTAILGGAGDLWSGSSDFTRRDDDGTEDIAEWFAGFGFKSAGRLVRHRHSAPARLTSTMPSHARSASSASSGALPSHRDDSLARISRGRATDIDSPPESPMADLGFMGDGVEGPFYVMGHNLNHDCPAFLTWTWDKVSGVKCA